MDTREHQWEAWLQAAQTPEIARELEAVYAIIADQVEATSPRCDASGRCCNFRAWEHRLYTTGLEAAYLVARLAESEWAAGRRVLTREAIEAAVARGDCPLLIGTRCGAHAIKPSGCRIYFCDPAAQGWQGELSERTLRMIRGLHERRGVPYRYGEWRELLAMFVDERPSL